MGISRVPAILIDGQLAECCAAGGVDEHVLRDAGVGSLCPAVVAKSRNLN